MTAPTAPTSPPAAPGNAPMSVGADDLRLVLFGMPAAGKSSLLGALSRAAESQEHLLGGKLIDETHGLADLRHQLYEANPRRTPDEVVPYPVRFEPLATAKGSASPPVDAVLMDCDGRVANDLLVRRKELKENSPEGTLAHEVLEADTLILVIDASAPPAQVEADFAEFVRFLRTIEQGRKERTEVSGLPVFLVLTKCDLLAKPGDSPADWMDHIEQRKREVDAHFREFLARGNPSPPQPAVASGQGEESLVVSPFGRINLHIWATAVKRPALAGSPAKPREPYGVAELFRQCMKEATIHRGRARRADRWLWVVVSLVACLLLGVVGVTVGLLLGSQSEYAKRVEDYRVYNSGGVAERLKGTPAQLREKLTRLEQLHDDPQFARLPEKDRTFIEGRITELKRYIDLLEKLQKERAIAGEQTINALNQRLKHLREDLKLPDEEWEETQAGKMRRSLIKTAETLHAGVVTARNWYLEAIERASDLWSFRYDDPSALATWPRWTTQVEAVLDPTYRPPFKELDPLDDTGLTYGNAFRFDIVQEARLRWDSERAKLRRLFDICSALGLATVTEERKVLVFPRGFTLEQASRRLADLKKYYPDFREGFVLSALPEKVVPTVRQVAGTHYQQLLEPGRAEVKRQLRAAGSGVEETRAKWSEVRKWLKSPTELADWRVLALTLLRLMQSDPTDPVRALEDFLGKDSFTLDPTTLVLEVPQGRNLTPRAQADLLLKRDPNAEVVMAFSLSGKPQDDTERRLRLYRFRLTKGQRMVFRPGDVIWAELDLSGGRERLVWSDARSSLYLFERLRNAPRLQSVNARSLKEGRLIDKVQLEIRPQTGVPRVPDLLPALQ